MVLDVVTVRPLQSVKLHVSVTVPPHGPGAVVWLEVTEPLMRHAPFALLV